MRRVLGIILKTVLVLIGAILVCALFLVGRWVVRHEDPLAFLPERPAAYVQVPSLRVVYDDWLNLPAADAVLSRTDLAPYREAIAQARGLALTRSPVLQKLIDVHADVVLLPGGRLLIVLDLGWRGIVTPLARVVGPLLRIKGFSFLNDAGTPLYRYSSGGTTIHAAFMENVAVIALDDADVKEALARRAEGTGLAARASRELLDRLKLRNNRAVRIVLDTSSLAADVISGSAQGARMLAALQLPGQSMLDAEGSSDRLALDATLPVSAGVPELQRVLESPHAPVGVLRFVPSSASLLTVSNLAPLGDLFRLAAALRGDLQDIYKKADDGARSVLGAGIDELVFSWAGSEVGAFSLAGSNSPVFFVRIKDAGSYGRAMEKITGSIVAGKDSSLVLDGVRIDRLSIPWYVGLILSALGVEVPEPYFLTRGDYFFTSMDAENLAAVVKASETGDNIAKVGGAFSRLTLGIPADPSVMVWWDSSHGLPFFVSRTGTLPDLLRVYGSGIAVLRASPSELRATLVMESSPRSEAQPLAGFPLSVEGSVTGDVLAFRFADNAAGGSAGGAVVGSAGSPAGGPAGSPGSALLAWVRDRSVLVLTDAAGSRIAEAKLEMDSVIVPDQLRPGVLRSIWAVSPGGTVWRFGPRLEPLGPFPAATGIASPMPPAQVDDKLALYSRADSAIVLVGPDGKRRVLGDRIGAPLFAAPSFLSGRVAFYPKSFDAEVYLRDLGGADVAGWPVKGSGISFCAPRIVPVGGSFIVAFLTQAGILDAWNESGVAVPSFPVTLPGVYYATPEPMSTDGSTVLVAISQDGVLSEVGTDGRIVRRALVPDLDGKDARIMTTDLYGDGRQEILLYGSGAFIAGYDSFLRPLPGFPLKGVTRPQVLDVNHDGLNDLVAAGLDGKIYAYSLRKGRE